MSFLPGRGPGSMAKGSWGPVPKPRRKSKPKQAHVVGAAVKQKDRPQHANDGGRR
jgi:hypothetical protein